MKFKEEKGAHKMDLVQTLKLFVEQHLECIGLVRPGGTPLDSLNTSTFKMVGTD